MSCRTATGPLLPAPDGTLQMGFRSLVRERFVARGLPFIVCGASLASHAVAILLMGPVGEIPGPGLDFIVLVILCAGLDVTGFVSRKISAFRAAHGTRFLVLLVALWLAPGTTLLIPILLTAPFFLETALAEEELPALGLNGVFLAGVMVALSFRASPLALAAYVLLAAPYAALGFLLVRYREGLVRCSARLERTEETVRNLFKANASLQLYAHHIESESIEKERNRITRDVHDSVGYALTNVIVMMNAGRLLLKENPEALDELFEKVGNQAEQALATTRQILHKLRDVSGIERIGLQAIAHLVKNFEGATDVHVTLSFGNLRMSYGRNLDSLLFRLVQEGLTNSFRHGQATRVSIIMRQTSEEIALRINDNGVGLPEGEDMMEGIGIAGMRERLGEYGGTLSAGNGAGGFELSAVIPYRTSVFEE
jgi:signal transduction histidine kinase